MGRGTMQQVTSRAIFVLSGYALHISMAHLLKGPSAYGALGLMVSVTNIARVLLSTGLPQATTKFIAAADEKLAYPILRTSLKIQAVMALVLTAVYLLGIPVWVDFLNDPSLTPYFIASAPLIGLMGAHQVLLGYFGGLRRFAAQSWLNTVYSIGRVVFAIAFVLAGASVTGVLNGFTVSLVIAIAISWGMVRPRIEGPNPQSRQLFAFSLPLMVLAIGQSFVVNLDILMLQRFFPAQEAVGYYTAAMNLGSSPYFIFTAFSVTLLPVVANALAKDDHPLASRLVARNISFLLVMILPVVAIVLAVPGPLLDFVYPATYRAASSTLAVLILSQSLLAVLAALTSAITATGRPKVAMTVWLVCIPIQVILGFTLIPRMGIMGAALSNLATTVAGVLIAGTLTWRYFRALAVFGLVAKATGAALVVFLLMSIPSGYSFWALPFACIAGVAVYFGILVATKAIAVSDITGLFKREASPELPIDEEVR